jgi:hypothetical protein
MNLSARQKDWQLASDQTTSRKLRMPLMVAASGRKTAAT